MSSKDLLKTIITDSQKKVLPDVWQRTLRIPTGSGKVVKRKLWGGEFWSDGYYVNTVSRYGNEEVIRRYVQEQGKEKEYQQLHVRQLKMFDKDG
jgi:REP element-mobilizing transposase RayT